MIARPVGLVAGGHDDTLDSLRLPAARLEDVVCPADVGLKRQERSVESDSDEGLRAEMEHDRRTALDDRPLDVGERLELALDDGYAPDVAAPEQFRAAVVIAKQDGNLRARCQE